jgi:HK97 gp10 family phage protein
MVKIDLKGFKELGERLKAFGPEVAKNGLRSADFAGARVIRDAAKRTVPVKSGLLKAQIYAARRRTAEHIAKYSIRVKAKAKVSKIARSKRTRKYREVAGPNVYGRFIEFGTSKMRPQPFLRPAFLSNVDNAIEAIRGGLGKAIDRAAKKLRK